MTVLIIVIVVALVLLAAVGFVVTRGRRRAGHRHRAARRGSAGRRHRRHPRLRRSPVPPPNRRRQTRSRPSKRRSSRSRRPRRPPPTAAAWAACAGSSAGPSPRCATGRIDQATWESLEEALIRADVGVATADALLEELKAKVASKEVSGGDDLLKALGDSIRGLLHTAGERTLRFDGKAGTPDVWLIVGVNGVGKTTTIGKLARRESAVGRSVLLAAGDTFRAAAAEQLAMWAERTGTEIVQGAEGGDPSAIVFDAVQRAAARGNDLVLADTAGRLHTKVNLVEELKKIRRVADRDPGNVTEVLLVLDATTGQNALVQARQFTEAVDVTGIVLTKLDGTAKGGIVIAVQRQLGLPVKLVGLGEGPDDLVDFDPDEFVDALLSTD